MISARPLSKEPVVMQSDSLEQLYNQAAEKLTEETPTTHLIAFTFSAVALLNALYFTFKV